MTLHAVCLEEGGRWICRGQTSQRNETDRENHHAKYRLHRERPQMRKAGPHRPIVCRVEKFRPVGTGPTLDATVPFGTQKPPLQSPSFGFPDSCLTHELMVSLGDTTRQRSAVIRSDRETRNTLYPTSRFIELIATVPCTIPPTLPLQLTAVHPATRSPHNPLLSVCSRRKTHRKHTGNEGEVRRKSIESHAFSVSTKAL